MDGQADVFNGVIDAGFKRGLDFQIVMDLVLAKFASICENRFECNFQSQIESDLPNDPDETRQIS